MDADRVYIISDDEDESSTRLEKRNVNFHHNVYEHNDSVPEFVLEQLDIAEQEIREEKLKLLEKEDVVYVPDDCEEEDLLLGPIRSLSHDIIFGKGLSPPPTEFPYGLLERIEKHLANSLRNVSFTTETIVWECVLEELSCIRFAYNKIVDVRIQ